VALVLKARAALLAKAVVKAAKKAAMAAAAQVVIQVKAVKVALIQDQMVKRVLAVLVAEEVKEVRKTAVLVDVFIGALAVA
jgi:hypothetical protein